MGLLDKKPGKKHEKGHEAPEGHEKAKETGAPDANKPDEVNPPNQIEIPAPPAQEERGVIVAQGNHQPVVAEKPLADEWDNTGDISLMSSEIKLSIVKIVQPTTQGGYEAGGFVNADTGQQFETLEGWVLDFQRGFVTFVPKKQKLDNAEFKATFENWLNSYWGAFITDFSDKGYVCGSKDRKTCQCSNGSEKPASTCAFNPDNWIWGKDKKPSFCHKSFAMLFNTLEDEVFIFSIHQPSSYESIDKFNTAIGTKATGRAVIQAGLQKRKYYSFPVTFSLKEESNDQGRYYVLQYAIGSKPISLEDEKFLADRAKTLAGISSMDKVLAQTGQETEKMVDMTDCPI